MFSRHHTGVRRQRCGNADRALLIVILATVAIAGTALLGCGGLFVWRFVLPVNVPVADLQTPDEKRAELRAAFSARDVGVPPEELREFERLFDDFTEIAGNQEDSRFHTLVHLERLHQEMHRSGQMPEQPRLFDIILQRTLADQLWLPVYATRYRIVRIAREANSEEAVVYVHFWDSNETITEMRMWTTRDSGRWKFFDWELLQCGMRASFEMALYESPGVEIYFELFEQVHRAERFFDQGDYDKGAERLHKCEELLPDIPHPLREQGRMHLISWWMNYGYHAEADELARQARSSSDTPGALYAEMVYNNLEARHELVLQLCDEYEEAIGPGPNAARYRAASLAALQRDAEANAAREQYLFWDPANPEMLAEFALDLADEDKGRVTGYLARAPEPLESTRMLAERFSSYGDRAGLSVILDYLEERPSTAADVEYVNGLLLESQGADEQAAERFLRALQQQSDEFARSDCFWSYMACMQRLGRELQAYELAPDPDEAFAYLANGDIEEDGQTLLSPALLRQIVERHRQRSPDDPWWAYHLGDLHCRNGEFDEALRCFEIGLGKLADDDYADSQWAFDSQIQTCLVEAGRWREAYERGDSTAETFESLARDLYYREQFDILRELVDLHRQSFPEDPMGCYYAAQLALQADQFDDADALLDKCWTRLDEDDYRRYSIRTARVNLHVAAGQPLDAYGDVPPDDETFGQLAAHFQAEHDVESLDALISLRRLDAPDDPAPLYWRANASFLLDDYAGVLETVADADPELVESMDEYARSQWDMLQLRSLLRTEQFPAAVELGRDISQRQGGSRALIVALTCSGQNDEALELLQEYVDSTYDSIYDDPDAGPLLRSDSFRSVRNEFPPAVPWVSTTPIVALLDQPLPISADQIQPIATRLFGSGARVVEVPNPHEPDVVACLVSIGKPLALVVCGRGPYQDDISDLRPGLFADVRRWEALAAHRAWCAFVLLDDTRESDPKRRQNDVRRLAGEFFDGDWLALWDGATNRIMIPSDGLPELLLDPESIDDLESAGESLWIYRTGNNEDRNWILQERIQRMLHAAIREWAASHGAATLKVVARISANPAGEIVEMQVDSVRRAPWYGWTLTGHLISDSQLVPWMKAGEPIRIESASVVDWTLTNGPDTSNARAEAREWWQRTRGESADTPTVESPG